MSIFSQTPEPDGGLVLVQKRYIRDADHALELTDINPETKALEEAEWARAEMESGEDGVPSVPPPQVEGAWGFYGFEDRLAKVHHTAEEYSPRMPNPESNPLFHDMISGAEMEDDLFKDPTSEVPFLIRHYEMPHGVGQGGGWRGPPELIGAAVGGQSEAGPNVLGFQFTTFTQPPIDPFSRTRALLAAPPALPGFAKTAGVLAKGLALPPDPVWPTIPKDIQPFGLDPKMQNRLKQGLDLLTASVSQITSKSPGWNFGWKEGYAPTGIPGTPLQQVFTPAKDYRGAADLTDPNFVIALAKALGKINSAYTVKDEPLGIFTNLLKLWRMGNAATTVNHLTMEAAMGIVNDSFTSLKMTGQAAVDVITDLPARALNYAKVLLNLGYKSIETAGKEAQAYAMALINNTKKFVGDLGSAIRDDVDAIQKAVVGFINALIAAIIADAQEFGKYVADGINAFVTWLTSNMNKLGPHLAAQLKKTVDDAIAAAKAVVAGVQKDVQKLIDGVVKDTQKLIETARKDFDKAVEKVRADFDKAVKDATADFNKRYNDLLAKVTDTIGVLEGQVKRFKDLQDRYDSFVKDTGVRFDTIEQRLGQAGAAVSAPSASAPPTEKKGGLLAMLGLGNIGRRPHHGRGHRGRFRGGFGPYPWGYPYDWDYGVQPPCPPGLTDRECAERGYAPRPTPRLVAGLGNYRPEVSGFV